ncbi:uncharacterized protein LOC142235304 [Haematobia irritans]|uniref:uncharacterized protein LOC142235304 n=1 Tax=Haematobia irritans TaxID=7368 RepID=UPI003F5099D1
MNIWIFATTLCGLLVFLADPGHTSKLSNRYPWKSIGNVVKDDTSVWINQLCVNGDGYYEDPEDCQSFIQCSNGIGQRQKCSSPLYWSQKLLSCTWTSDHCKVAAMPISQNEVKSSINIENICANGEMYHPDPEDCHYFIQCSNGIPYRHKCSPPLFWNQELLSCVWTSAHCMEQSNPSTTSTMVPNTTTVRPTTSTSTSPTTNPVNPTICANGEVYHPDPEDCHYFIQCSNGIPYRHKCATPLFWNQQLLSCVWTSDHCMEQTNPSTTSTEGPTTSTENPTTITEEPEDPTTSTVDPTTSTENPTTSTEEPTTSTEKPTTSTEEPTTSTADSTTSTENPTTSTDNPTTSTEDPTTSTENSTTSTEEPTTSTDNPTTITDEPTTSTVDSTTSTENPTTSTDNPTTSTEDPITSTENPTTITEEPITSTADSTTSTEDPTTNTVDPTTNTVYPTTSTEEPTTSTENPTTITEEPITSTADSTTSTENPTTSTDNPTTSTEDPITSTENPTTITNEPTTSTADSTTSTEDPTTSTVNPTTTTEEPTKSTADSTTITDEPNTSTEDPTTSTEDTTTTTEFPTTSPENPITTPNYPICDNDQLYQADPSNCEYYLECVDGRSERRKCPNGLYWNQEVLACVLGTEHCSMATTTTTTVTSSPTSTTTETTLTPTTPSQDCGDGISYHSDPNNCTNFIQCIDGQGITLSCPRFTYWNDKIGACVVGICDNGESTTSPGTTETTTTNPTTPSFCVGDETSYHPYPQNCKQFIQCYKGHPYRLNCPEKTYWNVAKGSCDVGDCNNGNDVTTTTPNPEISSANTNDPEFTTTEITTMEPNETTTVETPNPIDPSICLNGNQYYPDPYDCQYYIECSNGIPYRFKCADPLYWNQQELMCVWTEDHCDDQLMTTIEPTVEPTPSPILNICKNTDSPFLPHPNDCTKFIQCFLGIPITLSCPPYTHWNNDEQSCLNGECEPITTETTEAETGTTTPLASTSVTTEQSYETDTTETNEGPTSTDIDIPTTMETTTQESYETETMETETSEETTEAETGTTTLSTTQQSYETETTETNEGPTSIEITTTMESSESTSTTSDPTTTTQESHETETTETNEGSTSVGIEITTTMESSEPTNTTSDTNYATQESFETETTENNEETTLPVESSVSTNTTYESETTTLQSETTITDTEVSTEESSETESTQPNEETSSLISEIITDEGSETTQGLTDPEDLQTTLNAEEPRALYPSKKKEFGKFQSSERFSSRISQLPHSAHEVKQSSQAVSSLCSTTTDYFIADPENCHQFYVCKGDRAYLWTCGNELYWDSKNNVCDKRKENCVPTAISGHRQQSENLESTSKNSPPESPVLHPLCAEHNLSQKPKFLPFPQDCAKYYSCLNGLAYVEKCPEPFLWNPLNQICDNPQNVQCQGQETTITPSGTISPNTIYQIYPNDCNRYYQCEAKACPLNYHWNAQQEKCDFPHLAHCPFMVMRPQTPVTEYPILPPTAPTASPITPATNANAGELCDECESWCLGQGHIYLPYPSDCRKFIQCNGLAFVHKCPDQLLWNDKLKTCDRFCVRNNVS